MNSNEVLVAGRNSFDFVIAAKSSKNHSASFYFEESFKITHSNTVDNIWYSILFICCVEGAMRFH